MSVRIVLDPDRAEDYQTFLRVKSLPAYRFEGHTAVVPDEYAGLIGVSRRDRGGAYAPRGGLFDYQRDLAAWAVRKRKAAVFLDCGLGKTLVLLEHCRAALEALPKSRRVLVVSPLNVVAQTLAEAARWYGPDLTPEAVPAAGLQAWLDGAGGRFGLTNYEAIRDGLTPGLLGALGLDESGMLKSHYGAWGRRLIRLGRGLKWKLCLTGTPAPNDRIEYANHAVFLDQFPSVNSFLARFFVNRGETGERWELKAHALAAFYRALSHWCVFVSDPAAYGWKDNAGLIPPVEVTIHDVPLTPEQKDMVARAGGDMYGTPGGITSRSKLAQLAKGRWRGKDVPSVKPAFIRDLLRSWEGEQTLVWCRYNAEQDGLARVLPGCASVQGTTPLPARLDAIGRFQAGTLPTLMSKPKVLGLGLNLQAATRAVFSTLQDSYEEYYQAVKRANRVGSTRPLKVHIPITEIERPMVETVLAKARRVQADAAEQQALFLENRHGF